MSEPVDLDGIEARAKDADGAITAGDMVLVQHGAAARLAREDVPALVAEVHALRAKVAAVEDLINHGRYFTVYDDGPVDAVEIALVRRVLSGRVS